jgi:hypothetical protein
MKLYFPVCKETKTNETVFPVCMVINKQIKLYSPGCIENNNQMELYTPVCKENNKQMEGYL